MNAHIEAELTRWKEAAKVLAPSKQYLTGFLEGLNVASRIYESLKDGTD